MGTGIGCRLYIDGVRFADGCTDAPPDAPAALSGLSVTWGRETTVDQPEASTCSFEVLDPVGGTSFVEILRVGRRVDVEAVGTIWPDPTVPVWPDPSFEDGTAATITTNATATLTQRRARTGTTSLRLLPVDPTRRASVIIGPAPFSDPGDDPAAWDHIPTTASGQAWTYGASVFAPAGATLTVRPVLFSGPWRSAARVAGDAISVTGDQTWHELAATFVPAAAGSWVGLQVSAFPTGPTWDQVPPELVWDDVDPAWTWDDYGAAFVDDVLVLAPADGLEQSVLVFSGRITDLASSWPEDEPAPLVQVTAADFTADLENRQVGDEPWLVESVGSRFTRILDLAGGDVTADLDPDLAAYLVTWRDVDAQAVTGLLVELAESVDGVLWSATHATTGPYFVLEDPTKRASLYVLALVDGVVVIVPAGAGDIAQVSACDVLRDEVTWSQDVSDLITRTAVTWLEQGVDDDGEPETTERTVQRLDAALEAEHGSRRLSLSTQLQAEPDAVTVAERLLARTSDIDWRADGVVIDDADLDDATATDSELLLRLLDGTSRNGLPIQLIDLPTWAPAGDRVGVNLEGGKYTFDDGAWLLDLTVSNYAGQGTSARWDDLHPAWTWDDLDPAITWDDLRGVGVAEGTTP